MNIADFIHLDNTLLNPPKAEVEKFNTLQTKYDSVNHFESFGHLISYSESNILRSLAEKVNKEAKKARSEFLNKFGTLPKTDTCDIYTVAAEAPKVQVTYLHEVADQLGFALMPFKYMDDAAYRNEHWEIKRRIEGFNKLSDTFDIYALSPVSFYSVKKNVEDSEDLPIYAPPAAVQAFMAISMSIPMFRSMRIELKALINKVDDIGERLSRTEREVKNLASRVEQLAKQVESQQFAMLEARAVKLKLEDELEKERSTFFAMDPMLFAIPKSRTILDKGWAICGPCWGPDFPDIVAKLLKLNVVTDQRKMLSVESGKWSKYC